METFLLRILFQTEFLIERPEQFGGNISFKDFDSLEQAFAKEVSNCAYFILWLAFDIGLWKWRV